MDEKKVYISRTLEKSFIRASSQFPVMMVTGSRQVGKTTLLKHLAEDSRTYVTLDDPVVRMIAREDPALFLQRYKPPLLIDEIQYAPELLPYIKIEADKNKRTGDYWLTGSQQFHLMKNITESLAGRVEILNLLGLSQRELENRPFDEVFYPTENCIRNRSFDKNNDLLSIYKNIWKGFYPGLYSMSQDVSFYYSSYMQTYLQRDVRDLAQVGDEKAFIKFTRACASRTGQLLNIQDLSRDADISPITGKRWLSILESSYIIFLLEPFHSNLNKRLVKSPKLYFIDTGLAAYLTEWSSPEILEAGAMSGAFLETWIVSEFVKNWQHNGKRPPIYFYRDKDKKEIDLLIFQDGKIYPIEIKKTSSPTKDTIRHFKVLETLKIPVAEGCVLSFVKEPIPLTKSVQAVPVGLL